jgi:DNA polymerase III delta prime subunit
MFDSFDQFSGTATYIASEELRHAVNVAVALERPLLVRGEPGTGKTLLAENLASSLGLPLIRWGIKSTTKAKDGLYVYDTVARLARLAVRRDRRPTDVRDIAQLHQARAARSGARRAVARGAADRRDRQGRHRVPKRPAARARRDAVPDRRDRPRGRGEASGRS